MLSPNFRQTVLALCILSLMQSAFANQDENLQELEAIQVQVESEEKPEKEVVTAEKIKKEMINTAHDLVRYNTEVDVAEVGRYGNKGFAIRGVDGNRVAMSFDGVSLPTTESNELFSPYGYVYEGRFNPDTEVLNNIRITTGADSLTSGSGAMGGSVSYVSKNPKDMVDDGNLGGYVKAGYSNKNDEFLTSAGLAGVWDKAEFLVNYAHRKGHELKNHDMRKHKSERLNVLYDFKGNGEMGSGSSRSLLYPDPVEYKKDTALLKFFYNLNLQHRFGLSGIYQKQDTISNAWSKNTAQYRMPQDQEEMKGYGFSYRYTPENSNWLNNTEINYQYQDVFGLADTFLHSPSETNPYLTQREYRPTQTKTHQFTIDNQFFPISLDKFGNHELKTKLIYNKQDYKSTMVRLEYSPATYPNVGNITQAIQPYAIVLPDAKKNNFSFILNDDITFSDRFNAKLGLRYDYFKYAPYFQDDVYFGDINSSELHELDKNKNNTSLKFYQDYRNGVYNQKPSFKKFTYSAGLDYKLIPDTLALRYKIGTGFLAPSVTQMYSAFQGLAVKQIINPTLRPEKSLNHDLELEFKPTDNTVLTLNGYYSKYDDFIYTKYWENNESVFNDDKYGCKGRDGTCTMSMNLNNAKVYGLKIGAETDVSEKLKLAGKLKLSFNLHTSKDSAEIETDKDGKMKINTLAAVPTNFIFGTDYVSADNSWELHGRVRGLLRKQPKDTKTLDTERVQTGTRQECADMFAVWYGYPCPSFRDVPIYGYKEYVTTYKNATRGKNAFIFDVYGSKKFGQNQNIILNAGVYNITNVKYIPWETLRQFNNLTTNSMVDRDGHGFNRYTAPGRNFAISLEYKF